MRHRQTSWPITLFLLSPMKKVKRKMEGRSGTARVDATMHSSAVTTKKVLQNGHIGLILKPT